MFSREICNSFKNTYFEDYLRVAASETWQHQYFSMFINVHLNGSLWRAKKLHKKHWFYCFLLIELYNRGPATKFLKTFRTPFLEAALSQKGKLFFDILSLKIIHLFSFWWVFAIKKENYSKAILTKSDKYI